MKNRFLILTLIGLFTASIPAFAELTNSDAAGVDYLKLHGHSDPMIEATQITRARANGEVYVAPKNEPEYYEKSPVKEIRTFFKYIDPSYDDDSFMKHNIKTTPSIYDL